jgi:hypothetical protein
MRCCQHQRIMESWDMQSDITDTSIINHPLIRALSTNLTSTNEFLLWSHYWDLGWSGGAIYILCGVGYSLFNVWQTTQLLITIYLAPINHSQIQDSVLCHIHYSIMYSVSIFKCTMTGSQWQKSICWYLTWDKLVSVEGITSRQCFASRAYYLDIVIHTLGS